MIAAVESGQSERYFAWHPAPPFWNDYVGLLAGHSPVLDVGCGDGWIADHVADYTGIDASEAAVDRAQSLGRNVVRGSVTEPLPFENESFGAILLKDILEHLDDPGFTVRECLRILKPGGRIVAFSPDAQRWVWDDYTHKRPFSRKAFRNLFGDQGAQVERAAYEPLIWGSWKFCRVFRLSHRPRLFWWLAWFPWTKRNVMVVAIRPPDMTPSRSFTLGDEPAPQSSA